MMTYIEASNASNGIVDNDNLLVMTGERDLQLLQLYAVDA
jgi:hypothetical protein